MAKYVWQARVLSGSPLAPGDTSTAVTVVDESTGGAATIYTDETGGTVKANPFNIAVDGKIIFYADTGVYTITAVNGANTDVWHDVDIGLATIVNVDEPADLLALPVTLPVGTVCSTSADGKVGQWVIDTWTAEVDNEGTIKVDGNWSSIGKYFRRTETRPCHGSWFGATGDGSTDDLAACLAAITYASDQAAGGGRGGAVYFRAGRYALSGELDFSNIQKIKMYGDGFSTQFFPLGTGYNTMSIGTNLANQIHITIEDITVYIRSSQIGIRWESHVGGMYRCIFLPVDSPADGVTCIQLDQTAGNTGSWLTNIQECIMDLAQHDTSTNCTGIDIIGAANRINITNNTIAGLNGTGIRIAQYAPGAPTQAIRITGNDIESMTRAASTNIAIDVQGYAVGVWICNNYLEGIEGTSSRFLRVGDTADVIGLTFKDNYCLTDNPLPPSFAGIELASATSPEIAHNFYAPAGAGDMILGAITFGIPNQMGEPYKESIDLMESEQTATQTPAVDDTYEDVVGARTYTPINNSLPMFGYIEVVYTPLLGTGETYSFALKSAAGTLYTATALTDTPGSATTTKIRNVWFVGINDLGKLQVKVDVVAGAGVKILSARLYILNN